MAQLRQDYKLFQEQDTEILAIAHEYMANAKAYFKENDLHFPGLIDPDHIVFDKYDVANKSVSLGQRPGLFIVDKQGIVQFAHIGAQQWEIPPNITILNLLKELQK